MSSATSSSSSKKLFGEPWIQEVASRACLPPQSPAVVRTVSAAVESQLRILIQQSVAFQRKGRSKQLKVEHLNFTLRKHRLEPLYGLHGKSDPDHDETEVRSLEEIARVFTAPAVPLKPVLALHWLAVNGTQPAVPENPVVLSDKAQEELKSLPKEYQNLYVRIVGTLLQATDDRTQRAVRGILAQDQCLQPLVPLLARFFYTQIKAHSRSQPVLHLSTLLEALVALQSNAQVSLESHLTQLLPGVFTLVAAPQLGNDSSAASSSNTSSSAASSSSASSGASEASEGGHWALRRRAARLVASLVQRYQSVFPDLFARVCRTYLDALNPPSRALPTVYGGIVGLAALGEEPLRQLLLPSLGALKSLLQPNETAATATATAAVTDTQLLQQQSQPAGSEAMDVDDSADTSNSSNNNSSSNSNSSRKRPLAQMSQPDLGGLSQLQQQQQAAVAVAEEAQQCRQALREALAKLQRGRVPLGSSRTDAAVDLCDLEESLGVFLAAQSPQTLPHAFLSL